MLNRETIINILTLSAFYPPYSYGGYENRVCDVMDRLTSRGHQVTVLTTQPDASLKIGPVEHSYPVIRKLHGTRRGMSWAERLTTKTSTKLLGVGLVFMRQIWRDLYDLRLIDHTIRTFHPDIIYLGNILPLTRSLFPFLTSVQFPLALDDGGKTMEMVYEERGFWYRFLEEINPSSALVRWMKDIFVSVICFISARRLKSSWFWPEKINVIFNNYRSHQSFFSTAIPFHSSAVIHSGLDLEKFSFEPGPHAGQPLRIIVPGRIEPNKGQLDAVRLSAMLQQAKVDHHMTIVGDRWNTDYANQLEAEVTKLDLGERVRILPMQDKASLIELYHQSDICFFPSCHKTGFSRISLEAMACGCVFISYGNEGSNEIVRNEEIGFLVETGNLSQTLELIHNLAENRAEIEKVTKAARQELEQQYSIYKYIDQIESFLWVSNKN